MYKVAEGVAFKKLASRDAAQQEWQDYQRWLKTQLFKVLVPFATVLADLIPPEEIRLRRDIKQLLSAIQVHAFMHQYNRERDDDGYIIATIDDDYRTIRALMGSLMADSAGVKVKPATRQVVEAVEKLLAKKPFVSEDLGVSATDVANEIGRAKSTATRQLREAEVKGYVKNLEKDKSSRGRWRTTGQELTGGKLLPGTDELKRAYEEWQKEQRENSDVPSDDANVQTDEQRLEKKA
jgi:hypothetical protein